MIAAWNQGWQSSHGSERNWLGRKNHAKYVHSLDPFDGGVLGADMTMFPNPVVLMFHIGLEAQRTQGNNEDENGEGMPKLEYCLTMSPAQSPHKVCCWAAKMFSVKISTCMLP